MKTKEKINQMEEKGFNWLEIAEILNISYEEVRELAENEGWKKILLEFNRRRKSN